MNIHIIFPQVPLGWHWTMLVAVPAVVVPILILRAAIAIVIMVHLL